MNSVRGLILLLIAGTVCFMSTPGRADLAPIALKDGCVLPLALHESIRMDLQDVTIRLRKTSYTVDAVFRLYNTGETVTQWVGVPTYLAQGTFIFSLRSFNAWVDGQHVAFSEAPDCGRYNIAYLGIPFDTPPRWMVGQVTFPGHATTTIRVKYEAPLSSTNRDGFYIYENSRYWKDKIEKFVLTVDTREIGETNKVRVSYPDSLGVRALTKNLLRYEVSGLDPGHRALLTFSYRSMSNNRGAQPSFTTEP